MKIRFYFNDFTLYADIDWTLHILPKEGELVFLKGFINLDKGTTNVKAIELVRDSKDDYLHVPVYRGRERTDKDYCFLKDTPCVIIGTPPIWRIIGGNLTPCFSVAPKDALKILDALYPVHNVDDL